MRLVQKRFAITPVIIFSLVPFVTSIWYWSVLAKNERDYLFWILFFAFGLGGLFAFFLSLNYMFRFIVAVVFCGLFHRNIYMLSLAYYSPLIASICSQSLNFVFSYFVNAYFTCPADGEEHRRFGPQKRAALYVCLFTVEIALHYCISITLLDYVDKYWTWLITGGLMVCYSLIGVRYIFSAKKST